LDLTKDTGLKIELQGQLDQPWVITRRRDAAEVAWINDLTGRRVNERRIQIAVRCVEVHLIEEIEEFCAELNALRFTKRKAPDDREGSH